MSARRLPRCIARSVAEDLQTRMVFVGGPRQVGKTTLALDLLGATTKGILGI